MRSAAYYHANILVFQVFTGVKSVQDNVLHVITSPQAQAVNATTSNVMQLEMLRIIKELQRKMSEMKKVGQGAGNSTSKNREKKKHVKKNTSKYCWRHGTYAHESVDCIWKKLGIKTKQPWTKKSIMNRVVQLRVRDR